MRNSWKILSLVLAGVVLASCKSTSAGGGPSGLALDSGNINPGEQFSKALSTPGSYGYHCAVHPGCVGLQGVLVVVPVGTPIQPAHTTLSIDQAAGGSCYLLSTKVDSVHAGETVVWHNASQAPHTITSN